MLAWFTLKLNIFESNLFNNLLLKINIKINKKARAKAVYV
jgi:hypothetical protein